MDGVLLDSERLHMQAAEIVLRPYGVQIDENMRLEFMGLSELAYWRKVKEKYPELPSPEELSEKKNSLFWEIIKREQLVAFQGSKGLLYWLRGKKVKLGLVSSTPSEQAEFILKKTSLLPFFDLVVGGDMVKEGKPSPQIYLLASRKLGLMPEECIVVEDSKNGILAGLKGGMEVIAMRPSVNARDMARVEVFDFASLRKVLKNLLGSSTPSSSL